MGRGIRFTTEFKREAVRLVLTSGRPRAEIAEDLGVGLSSLTRWIGQHQANRLALELRRKPDSSSHRTPPVAVGALHFCEARPVRASECRKLGYKRKSIRATGLPGIATSRHYRVWSNGPNSVTIITPALLLF